MNKNEHREWTESDERAARKLLAKLIARTGKAAGCLQESPEKFIRPMAGTRGLGQSEEKNRRQFPHANDNGRKGESPERDFGEPLDRLSQFPCLGGFEWHGFKKGCRVSIGPAHGEQAFRANCRSCRYNAHRSGDFE